MRIKIRVAILLAAVLCIGSISKVHAEGEPLGFVAQLDAQEESEYQVFVDKIKTMTGGEYAQFLTERLEDAFKDRSGSLRAFIVVDVTDEANQPEPGFFESLLSTVPEPKEYGVNKVRGLLASKASSKTESAPFVMKDQYRSQNRLRHFQRIAGMLDKTSATGLVDSGGIVDIHVFDAGVVGSEFVTTHTPTGRIIPRRVQKQYDPQFLADGYFSDLMTKFETRDVVMVQVGLKKPDGYDFTGPWRQKMAAELEEFVQSWPDYEFQILQMNVTHVLMQTTKEHAKAMREDERVRIVQIGHFL